MILQGLSEVDFIRGSFSLIFVLISWIIGLKILSNYFKYKERVYLSVSLTWLFLSASWVWPAINFLFKLLFNQGLDTFSYLILANFFIPLAILSWVYSFGSLVFPSWRNKMMIIFYLICIPYEVLLIIFLFINPELIGIEESPELVRRTPLTFYFAIFAIIVAFTLGILFAKASMKSKDPNIRWKGRFILIAFIFFTIGAALDSFSWENLLIIVFIRLLLILSSINYYFGFFLPDKVAKSLIKD